MARLIIFTLLIILSGCSKESIIDSCDHLGENSQVQINEIIYLSGSYPIYDYFGFEITATGENDQEIYLHPNEAFIDTNILLDINSFEASIRFPSNQVCESQNWHDVIDGQLIIKDSTYFFDSIGLMFLRHKIYVRLENAVYVNSNGALSSIETLEFDNLNFSYLY